MLGQAWARIEKYKQPSEMLRSSTVYGYCLDRKKVYT